MEPPVITTLLDGWVDIEPNPSSVLDKAGFSNVVEPKISPSKVLFVISTSSSDPPVTTILSAGCVEIVPRPRLVRATGALSRSDRLLDGISTFGMVCQDGIAPEPLYV